MESLTEIKIIQQLKENNFENFNVIYEKYYKKTYFLALKMLKDEKFAEDITQEVFLDLTYSIKNLKNVDCFGIWLKKITVNKVNTKLKNIIKDKQSISNNNLDFFVDLTYDAPSPEELTIKNEILNNLFFEVNKLPESKKRAVLLYYFKELTLKEISSIENIPIGTVKSRLFAAKNILKKSLNLKKIMQTNLKVLIITIFVLNFNCFIQYTTIESNATLPIKETLD